MDQYIVIHPPVKAPDSDTWTLSASLRCGIKKWKQTLVVHAPGLTSDQLDNSGNVWAVLYLHKMMEYGGRFHIKGSISASLLRNIDYYTSAWSVILPENFHKIQLSADEVEDDSFRKAGKKAISCFSGGLDACFTAYRHARGLAGAQNVELDACLMVRGADIRKDYETEWSHARESAAAMVADLGIPHFYTVETDFRDMHLPYGVSYFSMLAACMRIFDKNYSYLMVGSDGPYYHFNYHSGNNAVTNHYLSSHGCELVTDGLEFSRTEKAAVVAQWPLGMEKLRVCWQGEDLSRNCGKCSKCKRTRLNFMAVGIDRLPCMPPLSDPNSAADIEISSTEVKELTMLLNYMDAHPLQPPPQWEIRLRELLKHPLPEPTKKLTGFFGKLFKHRKKKLNRKPVYIKNTD